MLIGQSLKFFYNKQTLLYLLHDDVFACQKSNDVLFTAANPCDNPSPCDDVNGYCNLVNGTEDCSCKRGYTLNAQNSSICDEIDECLLGIDACAQNCSNTVGGYTCSCEAGYTLDSNGFDCSGWCFVFNSFADY